jgi:hypothetical protein
MKRRRDEFPAVGPARRIIADDIVMAAPNSAIHALVRGEHESADPRVKPAGDAEKQAMPAISTRRSSIVRVIAGLDPTIHAFFRDFVAKRRGIACVVSQALTSPAPADVRRACGAC